MPLISLTQWLSGTALYRSLKISWHLRVPSPRRQFFSKVGMVWSDAKWKFCLADTGRTAMNPWCIVHVENTVSSLKCFPFQIWNTLITRSLRYTGSHDSEWQSSDLIGSMIHHESLTWCHHTDQNIFVRRFWNGLTVKGYVNPIVYCMMKCGNCDTQCPTVAVQQC